MGQFDIEVGNMRQELAKYKKKIDIVRFEDWTALYIDGKQVFGDHRLEPEELLDILGIEYTHKYIDYWDYCNEIPENIDDYDKS